MLNIPFAEQQPKRRVQRGLNGEISTGLEQS